MTVENQCKSYSYQSQQEWTARWTNQNWYKLIVTGLKDMGKSKVKRLCLLENRELKQPRRRRQQKPHKFAYLTMKNSIFTLCACIFHLLTAEDVLVLSRTWNDLFCICVDDVSIWWQIINFVLLSPKRWFRFNSRIVRTHFPSIMTLNHWKMIAETRSYISDDVLASVDVVFA